MSDVQKQKRWFSSLNNELSKYFNEEEKNEIIAYYEEMFNDKLDEGEDLDVVLDQYDPKKIARQMIPRVVADRKVIGKKTSNNLWLILLILFSTPVLIPLGIVYLSLMIVALSLIISGVAVVFIGGVALIAATVRTFTLGLSGPDMILSLGISLLGSAVAALIGYALIKLSWIALQYLAISFGKLMTRKKDKK